MSGLNWATSEIILGLRANERGTLRYQGQGKLKIKFKKKKLLGECNLLKTYY